VVNKSENKYFFTSRLPILIFSIWAGFFIWLLIDNRYQSFLQPHFKFLLITAAVILSLFVIISLFKGMLYPNTINKTDFRLKAVFFIFPAYLMVQVSDMTLGSHAFSNRNVNSLDNYSMAKLSSNKSNKLKSKKDILNNGNNEMVNASIRDLVTLPEFYHGNKVKTMGMIYNGDNTTPEGYLVIFKFLVTCCMADAQPLGMLIKRTEKDSLENDTWVNVYGSFKKTRLDEQEVLHIIPDSIQTIETPSREKQFFSPFN
jgi:uncharacterized repeat protein (TIGR03943 family)